MGSRPTAVDLSNAIKLLKMTVNAAAIAKTDGTKTEGAEAGIDASVIRQAYIKAAEKILEDDLTTNLAIGRYGAEYLRRQQLPVLSPVTDAETLLHFTTSPPGTQGAPDRTYRKLSVVTHCNTGSLATSGHGTALGIIRSLHKMNYLDHAYCTETRPYNQGARLTAFELVYEKIPSTLITDSMAGALFSRLKAEKNISAVIVGADRVARNGDTANKIGTYSLAVLAKYHGVKFIVAAPTTSIDLETVTGADIVIENRPPKELTQISGAVVDAATMNRIVSRPVIGRITFRSRLQSAPSTHRSGKIADIRVDHIPCHRPTAHRRLRRPDHCRPDHNRSGPNRRGPDCQMPG